VKLLLLIIFLLSNILNANEVECTNKKFLLNFLKKDAVWYPIGTNIQNGYAPFNAIKVQDGALSIITPGSDFILRHLGISYTNEGSVQVILQSTKYYRSEVSGKFKKYFDKTFILKAYNNDCSLAKIVLEIYIDDTNISKIKKDIFIFKKNEKNEKIYYGINSNSLPIVDLSKKESVKKESTNNDNLQ